MKKLKKFIKNKYMMFLTIFLMFLSISYSLMSQNLSLETKATIVKKELPSNQIEVTYTIDKWLSNNNYEYIIKVNIKNNGLINIEKWQIEIPFLSDVSKVDCWTTICNITNNNLTIKNQTYNSNILIGQSVEIGFNFSSQETNYDFKNYKITINDTDTTTPNPDPTDINLETNLIFTNGWINNNRYYKEIKLTILNNSDYKITEWEVQIDLINEIKIEGLWNVKYHINENILKIKNETYNGTIQNQAYYEITLQVSSSTNNFGLKVIKATGK